MSQKKLIIWCDSVNWIREKQLNLIFKILHFLRLLVNCNINSCPKGSNLTRFDVNSFFSLARFSKVCGFQRKIQFCTEFFCSSVSNTFYILFKPLYPCSTGCNQQCIGYIIYIWYKPLYPCSTGCNQQCIGYFLQNIQRGSARSSASSKGRSQNNP